MTSVKINQSGRATDSRTLAGSVLALHEARAKAVESVSFVPARDIVELNPRAGPGASRP